MYPRGSGIGIGPIAFVFSLCLLFLPAAAFGEGAIAGVVTDATGAVVQGVRVEARSPALIERVRTVVTDAAGQYRIENLRAGVYSVAFLLNGFSPFVRTNIELTGSSTITVDAQLRVGSLTDTITVTGETPLID